MAFAIHISDQKVSKDYLDGATNAVWGEIEIEDFRERVIIPLDYWAISDYVQQWEQAIKEILENGAKRGALVVEAYDPGLAEYVMCWPVYVEDNRVYIQNKLLILENLPKPFDIKNVDNYIEDRETVDEEGNKLSEWSTTLDALNDWHNKLKVSK